MDDTKTKNIYLEKQGFVAEFGETLWRVPYVDTIEYRRIESKYTELVKITYTGGEYEFINVTGNSIAYIGLEIMKAINLQDTEGQAQDSKMVELWDKWWKETD